MPQFIEDESRLVGPFTFTQIFILVIGGALAFIFYKVLRSFIGIPIALIIGFLTGLLTFGRLNEMPLYKMIIPMIKHFILPKSYQWSQPRGVRPVERDNRPKMDFKSLQPKKDLGQIDDLTKILDKGNE